MHSMVKNKDFNNNDLKHNIRNSTNNRLYTFLLVFFPAVLWGIMSIIVNPEIVQFLKYVFFGLLLGLVNTYIYNYSTAAESENSSYSYFYSMKSAKYFIAFYMTAVFLAPVFSYISPVVFPLGFFVLGMLYYGNIFLAVSGSITISSALAIFSISGCEVMVYLMITSVFTILLFCDVKREETADTVSPLKNDIIIIAVSVVSYTTLILTRSHILNVSMIISPLLGIFINAVLIYILIRLVSKTNNI